MAATDKWSANSPGIIDPGLHAAAVTPNNSTDLAYASRALYVGGAGAVKVDMAGGETGVIFAAVPAGMALPIRVTRVYSTGTDATNIVAIW